MGALVVQEHTGLTFREYQHRGVPLQPMPWPAGMAAAEAAKLLPPVLQPLLLNR